MDKLKMQTANRADENFRKLAEMFPNAVTETIDENGEVVRAIDKDVLMQEINTKVVDGKEERYQFTWPDKKKSVLLANAPINKTLRPCREESVDFDNTENLYIEGDNLEVLKLLQETYLGKIKMIYIDPPYNTGNDFVYEDDFRIESGVWSVKSGDYDDEGSRLVKNLESNGRFHTDWLNMIYPRLKLAKDLLSEDGVVFISIDDNEQENLKKCCDEIFGGENFLAQVIWERAFAPVNLKKHFSENHDYVICYAKNISSLHSNGLVRKDENRYKNLDNDPRGVWTSSDMTVGPVVPEKLYEITLPSGRTVTPTNGRCWLFTKNRYEEMLKDNRIWFGEKGDNVPRVKKFLSEVKQGITPLTIWKYSDVGHSQDAAQRLKQLFDGQDYFDYPKPVNLIKQMLQLYTNRNSIVMDFFSGSATTAHAVMQLNAEDGGKRKFIMVQLPEITYDGKKEKYRDTYGEEKERYIIDETTGYPVIVKDSEARKAGYWTVSQIGKERIRRAGKKIKEDRSAIIDVDKSKLMKRTPLEDGSFDDKYAIKITDYDDDILDNLDIGFRVLKLDSSNMKDVYYNPSQYEPSLFEKLEDNIKEDRTSEDLLFQVMLDLGILLSSKIQCEVWRVESGAEYRYFNVEDGFLIACFDKNITEELITEVAKKKPYYFVMRDSSMASDSVATNFEQIFATFSPDTVRKVL